LQYFGERYSALKCNCCDNCSDEREQVDGTIIAQKILSCVYRVKQNVGVRMVMDVLRGSKSQAVLERGYHHLSTYGILKDLPEAELRYYMESLIQLGVLERTAGEYPILRWNDHSRSVVDGKKPIFFVKQHFRASVQEKEIRKKQESVSLQYDPGLFEALRRLRQEYAREENVPLFVVFSDRALQEMAVYFPQTQSEFSKINGVGPVKWVKYGERFLEVIRSHTPQHRDAVRELPNHAGRVQSMEETAHLFLSGRGVEEIVQMRQKARSTVVAHLVEAIEHGFVVDIGTLVSLEKQKAIRELMQELGVNRMTPLKERLPAEFTYDDIRFVFAFEKAKK
jgi:ATP-dependent DNA helicase RecQ